MAKCTGPLFGFAAHGLFGPRMVFSKRKTGQQVRFQRKQKNHPTPGQISNRLIYSDVVSAWYALSDVERLVYNEAAFGFHYTGYNLFVREYFASGAGLSASIYGDRFYGSFAYGKE